MVSYRPDEHVSVRCSCFSLLPRPRNTRLTRFDFIERIDDPKAAAATWFLPNRGGVPESCRGRSRGKCGGDHRHDGRCCSAIQS